MSKMSLLAALVQSPSNKAMACIGINRIIVVQLRWEAVDYPYFLWCIDFAKDGIADHESFMSIEAFKKWLGIHAAINANDNAWRPLEDFKNINGEHHKAKLEQYASLAIERNKADGDETKSAISAKMNNMLPCFESDHVVIDTAKFPKTESRMIHVRLNGEPWQALNIDTMQWELWETA